jgi:hypothetical protein
VTAEGATGIIEERTEATMNGDTRNLPKQAAKAPQSTVELLCLLATYEAYGTGLAWSGCPHALAARSAGR